MLIGLDFDNTIACYDSAFHAVAVVQGLVPPLPALDKKTVKAYLLEHASEETWTELQGLVYGREIGRAQPFAGVLYFVRQASLQGHQLFIVSHKTRHPVIGEPSDLHLCAFNWLENQGFFEQGLTRERVFFERTREQKIARIRKINCAIFIDDLAEVFLEEQFPPSVDRWLHQRPPAQVGPWKQFDHWGTALQWLT